MNSSPDVMIRLGSHSEKEYVLKLARLIDGVIFGANLIEATPGATSSLIVQLAGKLHARPYYIDPMTHAFGAYRNPTTGEIHSRLEWIRVEQKNDSKSKPAIRRSYSDLSSHLGTLIGNAANSLTGLVPSDFENKQLVKEFCENTIRYQRQRLVWEFDNDDIYKEFAWDVPPPSALFAPYFYIDPSNEEAWLKVVTELACISGSLSLNQPLHMIFCADHTMLKKDDVISSVISLLSELPVKGVWLWFSKFKEEAADEVSLKNYVRLVKSLSESRSVYSLHGGYFSLLLSKLGLRGISHGVGYGEQKDVVPIVGQSTPTVRYYLPDTHRRIGIPMIEHCFQSLGIHSPKDFHKYVCDCVICKGVVSTEIGDFAAFGETQPSTISPQRRVQTPAAAKRCRFHFMLSRIRERGAVKRCSLVQLLKELDHGYDRWSVQPVMRGECDHLKRWSNALSS